MWVAHVSAWGFASTTCKFWITSLVFCSKFLSLIVGVEMHRMFLGIYCAGCK
jgi:hypothetical protein